MQYVGLKQENVKYLKLIQSGIICYSSHTYTYTYAYITYTYTYVYITYISEDETVRRKEANVTHSRISSIPKGFSVFKPRAGWKLTEILYLNWTKATLPFPISYIGADL